MFDWNDEKLVNIIWGEADEGDDHIVPYPDGNKEKPPNSLGDYIKKEWNDESANAKPAEQKESVAKFDTNEGLPAAGLGFDSWFDLSLSSTSKPDQDSIDEQAELDNGSEIFQNQNKDKEDSDLVDYGWDSIGSFDDLDTIFSNADPVFGQVSLGSADELWSSSKDVTSSPDKSASLSTKFPSLGSLRTSEHRGKEECMLDQDQPLAPGYGKVNDLPCSIPQNTSSRRKLLQTCKRSEEKSDAKLQDLFGTWPAQENQFLQLDSQYTQIGQASPSPCLAPSVHAKIENKFPNTPPNPLAMTPREKIEKLRRRQQMRAMDAIQKQQQQFISPRYSSSDQVQLVERGNLEVADCHTHLPSLDQNSSIESDDSRLMQMAIGNCSLEDAILYRLQDIVAKLDIQLRLCIRDSLCRLAQSAMQRQDASDTNRTKENTRDDLHSLAKDETSTNTRFARTPEVETATNSIDRTVAHLLFHTPQSSSCVNTSKNASNCEAGYREVTKVEAS